MGKHWQYEREPSKPSAPYIKDENFISYTDTISSWGSYEEINLEDLKEVELSFNFPENATEKRFFIEAHNEYNYGDTELTVEFKVSYKVPTSDKEKQLIISDNKKLSEKYQEQLSVYQLQLTDWCEIKKVKEKKESDAEYKKFLELKKKFEK